MSATTPAPGDWLRDQMEQRRLSTRDVAEAVGLRDQAVYYWLTGRTAPKDDAATKLADLLDVPEVEVRRRFGLWIPEDQPAERPDVREELRELRKQLVAILERIDEIRER